MLRKLIMVMMGAMALGAVAGEVAATAITAQQRYPWNGLVDITVTISGAASDVERADCMFYATNNATWAAVPVVHVDQVGNDTGSGSLWTRCFLWNAAADVGAVKIDDVVLTCEVKFNGGWRGDGDGIAGGQGGFGFDEGHRVVAFGL